ncbi:hypothetical protein M3Y97_00760200 [Aphelenchoides bicaudatus]|nr:hypothetical protein M3Y97_00760200 [Aphelenchoides bicaudatus]
MKCNKPNNECQRSQCAGAMRRFSRYVNKSLLESMMFCQCSFSDVNCKHQQALMYPRCLYDLGNEKPNYSCTQQLMLCQHDSYCARSLNALNNSCPLVGKAGSCVAKDFGECRLALIGVRGTELESPCYCNKNDEKCAEFQNMVLPSHACVEDSMIDFVAGGSIATASDRQLPKIKSTKSHSSTRRNQKKLKNQNQTSTSTSTTSTTTTVAPFSEKSELDENEEDSEIVSTEDTSTDEIEDDLEVQESDNVADNVTTTSKPSKLASTLPSEIRTKIGGKGIKISKGSTPKIINEAPVTKAPAPPREGLVFKFKTEITLVFSIGGCPSRNIEGDKITHYKNSVFRQYNDLAGRCSSYCECSDKEKATCSPLSCLPEGTCTTSQTKVVFGERLFIEGRGACLCHSDGKFICDSAEGVIELDPGIYISLGFSREELKMLKEKVPKPLLEKCGLVSPDISIQNDIASRLQFALERVLPKDMLCRLALIERYSREDTMLLQIQWYGVDTYSNTTKDKDAHWHVGKLEKVCAPFVRKLEYQFMLERAARYQLVLSTVKQLRVYELLDGLVVSNSAHSLLFHCHFSLLLSMFLLLIANAQLNRIPNDLIHNLVP